MTTRWRTAGEGDEEFLRILLQATMADELNVWAWPEAMRGPLLEMQYRVRRNGVRGNFPNAEVRILLEGEAAVGWMVVDEGEGRVHVVDIAVMPGRRGQGIGTGALVALLEEADGKRQVVELRVNVTNRAKGLYERLGFRRTGGDEVQDYLEHPPPVM